MATNQSIKVTSDALKRLASELVNRRRANQQLSVQLEGWVLRNFASEGGLTLAGAWVPLKPETILRRINEHPGRAKAAKVREAKSLVKRGFTSRAAYNQTGAGLVKILQDTGAMRQSFAGFFDDKRAGVGARSGSAHADLTKIHQDGSEDHNIPARPMLPTPDQALEMATAVYAEFVSSAREAANL